MANSIVRDVDKMRNKKKLKSNIGLKGIFTRGVEKSLEGPSANFKSYSNSIIILIWFVVILAGTLDMIFSLKTVVRTFPPGEDRTKEIFKEVLTGLAICGFPGIFYVYLNGYSIHQLLRMSELSGWNKNTRKRKSERKSGK